MSVVVIGGQASGVGKTGVICGLLAAIPERRWTAIKITQCSHKITQHGREGEAGKACDCELDGQDFAVSVKRDRRGQADTSRYLAAGAARALWVRTLPGDLGKVISRIEEEIARAGNVMIESNSVMEFLRPDVYALAVSPDIAEFKAMARRYLERADAILVVASANDVRGPGWLEALGQRVESATSAPQFSLDRERLISPEFVALVRRRLGAEC